MGATSGFRGYQPRAVVFKNVFTGAVIATPVLDLSSVRGPQGYADRSGTGANGAPIGAPTNVRGVFDEAIKFGGVRDGLNCGTNAPLNVSTAMAMAAWITPKDVTSDTFLIQHYDAAGGYALRLINSRLYIYDFLGATWPFSTASLMVNRAQHIAATLVPGGAYRLFIDGLQDTRGVFVGQGASAGLRLSVGAFWSGAAYAPFYNGSIELPQVYNGALSPEQIYRQYLQAKDVPIYYDTFESYVVTPVAKAVGSMCGPFRVVSGTLSTVVDANGQKWVQPGVGGEGIAQWPGNDAFGTWEFDFRRDANGSMAIYMLVESANAAWNNAAQNGYAIRFTPGAESISIWRVTGGVLTSLFIFQTSPSFTLGVQYRLRVVRRIGGSWMLYIKGGEYPDWCIPGVPLAPYTLPAVDNVYTSGMFHTVTGQATDRISGITRLRVCERPASFPWEFSTGTYAGVVSGSTIWMRCLTAGVTYLPKDLDWQTMTFKLYKGADANVTDLLFVASEIGGTTFANQNGYVLRIAADESVQLVRTTGGIEAAPTAQTAAGFVAVGVEYTFRINRVDATNAYEFYIRGGAYATWTLMFAATLGIHTSSNYWCNDLDAGDRTTAPVYYHDIRTE